MGEGRAIDMKMIEGEIEKLPESNKGILLTEVMSDLFPEILDESCRDQLKEAFVHRIISFVPLHCELPKTFQLKAIEVWKEMHHERTVAQLSRNAVGGGPGLSSGNPDEGIAPR
jgi:hypothetical protein